MDAFITVGHVILGKPEVFPWSLSFRLVRVNNFGTRALNSCLPPGRFTIKLLAQTAKQNMTDADPWPAINWTISLTLQDSELSHKVDNYIRGLFEECAD